MASTSTSSCVYTGDHPSRCWKKSSEKESFSDVILKYYPSRRKLSEVLAEIGVDTELADSIEAASQKMRHARIREAEL
jgi:predicted CopG family antitoxin